MNAIVENAVKSAVKGTVTDIDPVPKRIAKVMKEVVSGAISAYTRKGGIRETELKLAKLKLDGPGKLLMRAGRECQIYVMENIGKEGAPDIKQAASLFDSAIRYQEAEAKRLADEKEAGTDHTIRDLCGDSWPVFKSDVMKALKEGIDIRNADDFPTTAAIGRYRKELADKKAAEDKAKADAEAIKVAKEQGKQEAIAAAAASDTAPVTDGKDEDDSDDAETRAARQPVGDSGPVGATASVVGMGSQRFTAQLNATVNEVYKVLHTLREDRMDRAASWLVDNFIPFIVSLAKEQEEQDRQAKVVSAGKDATQPATDKPADAPVPDTAIAQAVVAARSNIKREVLKRGGSKAA